MANKKQTISEKKRDRLLKLSGYDLVSCVLDQFGINYSVIDKDGNYIIQNNTMGATCKGLKNAAEIDKTTWENCKSVMRSGERTTREEKYKNTYFLSIKQPIMEKGKCLGIMVISIDITHRKEAEKLRVEAAAAKKATQFAHMIAGSIAHELRTPLANISLQMDLIDMVIPPGKKPSEEQNNFCRQATAEVKKVVKAADYVITDFLTKLKSLSLGQIGTTNFKNTPILDDIENVLASYPFTASERALVKFDIAAANADSFTYFGNEHFTRHILVNLIKNALRAIKEADKGEITITLKRAPNNSAGEFNQLIFRDTASGIDTDLLPKLFDQFESKTTSDSGTGLGLSFCKMVMHSYNGSIICNSKKGAFAEFVLSFPQVTSN